MIEHLYFYAEEAFLWLFLFFLVVATLFGIFIAIDNNRWANIIGSLFAACASFLAFLSVWSLIHGL